MMELYSIKEVDFQHKDKRGKLIQLVHEGYKQVNVLESKAGSIRGAHFHKRSFEAFYLISGSVEVEFSCKEANHKTVFNSGDFFEVFPNVVHNMYFPENCIMVQMYDIPVENEDGSKDIFMEEEFDA